VNLRRAALLVVAEAAADASAMLTRVEAAERENVSVLDALRRGSNFSRAAWHRTDSARALTTPEREAF
jgi:hypothetical protein